MAVLKLHQFSFLVHPPFQEPVILPYLKSLFRVLNLYNTENFNSTRMTENEYVVSQDVIMTKFVSILSNSLGLTQWMEAVLIQKVALIQRIVFGKG